MADSNGWSELSFKELCEHSAFGPRFSSDEYAPNGNVACLRTMDISFDGRINFAEMPLAKLDLERFQNHILQPGDLAITRTGAYLGKTAVFTEFKLPVLAGAFLIRFRLKREIANPWFYHYVFTSPFGQQELRTITTGSAQPNLNITNIHSLRFPVPPLAEQDRIVDVMKAYDDKIELNRRMNETLEAMARAIFKSWFVDFDPVRAKLDGRQPTGLDPQTAALFPNSFEHVDGELVPSGWKATTLGDVIEILDSKRIPLSRREREKRQGPYPYHGAAAVMDYVDDYLFNGVYTLMGEDGSVINEDGTPVMQYVWGKFWVNNHAHVLRGKNGVSCEHLLLHLEQSIILPFITGAVQLKLNQGNLKRIPFMLPTVAVCDAFASVIGPLYAQIRSNSEQTQALAATRDALLPKLLSGEVRVGD